MAQPVAVALAFRLVSVPLESTIPVVKGIATVEVVAATEEVPKTSLSVLPEPNDAVASPVSVKRSPVEV